MVGWRTRKLARQVEREILSSPGATKDFHPNTIKAVALFEALSDEVPIGSTFWGLQTLLAMEIDNLRGQGLPVPPQLMNAVKEMTLLVSEMKEWEILRESLGRE